MSRVLILNESVPMASAMAAFRNGFGSTDLNFSIDSVVEANGPATPVGRSFPFPESNSFAFPASFSYSLPSSACRLFLPHDAVSGDGKLSLAFGSAEVGYVAHFRKSNAVAEPAMPAVLAATRGALALSCQPCVGCW
jgi:hypothetical protein